MESLDLAMFTGSSIGIVRRGRRKRAARVVVAGFDLLDCVVVVLLALLPPLMLVLGHFDQWRGRRPQQIPPRPWRETVSDRRMRRGELGSAVTEGAVS